MRLQHLVLALVCMATAVLAGCTTRSCTAIGGIPGLIIENPEAVIGLGAVEIRVCVTETACATQPVPEASVGGPVTVETELLSESVTTVTVSATDAQGAEVLREIKPVTPTVSHPNGKGCDPTVWAATVTL